MKKIVYLFILIGFLFASCKKEPQPMSRTEIRQKTDSLTRVQINESNERAKRDLDHRIKIEVRVKADSILNARLHPQPKAKMIVPKVQVPQKPHLFK